MRGVLEIVQIAVRLPDESLAVVSLEPERMAMLVPMIEALSDGSVKVVPVPGMKLLPISEVRS